MGNHKQGKSKWQYQGVGLALDKTTLQALDRLATDRRQSRSQTARELLLAGLRALGTAGCSGPTTGGDL